jgi:Glycosyltransferase family 9 (heptosyltransferase)
MRSARRLVLFEPWHLGDALIAWSIALQDPGRLCLACNPKWHTLLNATSEGMNTPQFLGVSLLYINKVKPVPWDLGELPEISIDADVISIRGDIRDYFAAKRIFSKSKVGFRGWTAFLARRSRLLDLPFSRGWLSVANRYEAWASLAEVPWEQVHEFYRRRPAGRAGRSILIHVGAKWRAKQYPHVAELAESLRNYGDVKIVAGKRDPVPDRVEEGEITRLMDRDLVAAFRASSLVIANDSGPMHLAALLGCRTLVITRVSGIDEWLPPFVIAVRSRKTPTGYRPDPAYEADRVIGDWPTTEEVLRVLMQEMDEGRVVS